MASRSAPSRARLLPVMVCFALFGLGLLALPSLAFGAPQAAARLVGIVLLTVILPL